MEDSKWQFWKRLYNSWRNILDNYIKDSVIGNLPGDLPYWHSERASTSFLAAAAWKMERTIAIEEYYTERVFSDTRKRYKGHCDLWVKSKDFSFSAEVKQLWPKNYKKEIIDKKIEEAESQLSSLAKIDKKASYCLFSICFISPRFDCNVDHKTEFNNFRVRMQTDFKNKDSRIFFYYPNLGASVITWENKEKYPGVIMLIKEFKECDRGHPLR